jgi:hypothetical protein
MSLLAGCRKVATFREPLSCYQAKASPNSFGVGKNPVINLIMRRDAAQTLPDAEACTSRHTLYEVNLGTRSFKLWKFSSIESKTFPSRLLVIWRLKMTYKKLQKDNGVYLILCCMRTITIVLPPRCAHKSLLCRLLESSELRVACDMWKV